LELGILQINIAYISVIDEIIRITQAKWVCEIVKVVKLDCWSVRVEQVDIFARSQIDIFRFVRFDYLEIL